MPQNDVTAESSTATQEIPQYVEPSSMTADQRNAWLLKGEIPLAGETTEDSPPSAEETDTAKADGKTVEPAPASQPATQEPKPNKQTAPRKAKTAEDRKTELNQEIQELLTKRNQLHKEVETGVTRTSPPVAAPPVAAQPQPVVAQPQPAAQDPKPTPAKKSDGTKWKDWAEYETAKDEWLIREGQRRATSEQHTRQIQAHAAQIGQSWKQRCDTAIADTEMTDFQKVAFNPKLPVSPTMHGFIVTSEVGPKILYHLGQNPQLALQIAESDPFSAARALSRLESEFGGKPAATPGGKAPASSSAHSAPAPKKPSRTPEPGPDLGARNSAPADEEEAAVRNDDVRQFMDIQLRKDLAIRK
jgi:hypothetical protein